MITREIVNPSCMSSNQFFFFFLKLAVISWPYMDLQPTTLIEELVLDVAMPCLLPPHFYFFMPLVCVSLMVDSLHLMQGLWCQKLHCTFTGRHDRYTYCCHTMEDHLDLQISLYTTPRVLCWCAGPCIEQRTPSSYWVRQGEGEAWPTLHYLLPLYQILGIYCFKNN